eukprot:SAG31_NODE_496_length_14862_cov_9.280837_16_plen_73_part_00
MIAMLLKLCGCEQMFSRLAVPIERTLFRNQNFRSQLCVVVHQFRQTVSTLIVVDLIVPTAVGTKFSIWIVDQ